MTTKLAEKAEVTEDGKGATGDLYSCVPTGEERQIQEVYKDLVHSNDGLHLSGGISDKDYC